MPPVIENDIDELKSIGNDITLADSPKWGLASATHSLEAFPGQSAAAGYMLQVTSGEGEANHQRFIRAGQNPTRNPLSLATA